MVMSVLQPAANIRSAVRSDKGLPLIINILSPSHVTLDVIARTAAICLRNLAVDTKNKELIGMNFDESLWSTNSAFLDKEQTCYTILYSSLKPEYATFSQHVLLCLSFSY